MKVSYAHTNPKRQRGMRVFPSLTPRFSLHSSLLSSLTLRVSVVFVCCLPTASVAVADETISFHRDIKPILSNRCFRCHGPDPNQRKGGSEGLRLDNFEGATADLGGHAAIAPSNPSKSELVRRINSTDPDEAMPPKSAGPRLTPRETELLTRWITQGAKYTMHWSYQPPLRPALPNVKDSAWPRNEIDRFILSRLESEGLRP